MGALYTVMNLVINEDPRFLYSVACTSPSPGYRAGFHTTSVPPIAWRKLTS